MNFAINLSSCYRRFATVASGKDFISTWHLLLIYWKMQFQCCYGMRPFNTFHHCCCYWTEKWICTKIARRKFDAKECKLRSKCHICIPISTRGPVDRYRNLAFITFAQIYSLVCTFSLHICGEQIWCKSIFSSAIRKKRRKRK